jgi:hypothetical protein
MQGVHQLKIEFTPQDGFVYFVQSVCEFLDLFRLKCTCWTIPGIQTVELDGAATFNAHRQLVQGRNRLRVQ